MYQTTFRLLPLAMSLAAWSAETLPAHHAPVGGGVGQAGFTGAYFANPDFQGTPAFTRRDVRISFDWKEGPAGRGLPVGGSTGPGLAGFPLDDFSVRWTGRVVPRFSEAYTLRVTGRDGLRVRFAGTVLVDSLQAGVVKEVSTGPLKAGDTYDLVFEYVDRAGTNASEARLEWSSPSTPWEVVDPLSYAQTCLHQASRVWNALEMADMVRMPCGYWTGTDEKEELPPESLDENGWPNVATCGLKLSHYGEATYAGLYRISFTGSAAVELKPMEGSWHTTADGSGAAITGKVPKGTGYSAANNTTTLWFTGSKPGHLFISFTDAEYEPGKPGVRDLAMLYPVANHAPEHHQPGEIYIREARAYYNDFTILRQHIGTSDAPGWTWEERTRPAYFRRDHQRGWGYCLEELIMAMNDVGKDLHLCFGAGWNEDFMRKFAQLVRYGSDGVNPYERYVENPRFPPLNPNLRIYLEHSNELPWAVYPRFVWDDFEKKAKAEHPDWKIVNYDGVCTGTRGDNVGIYRYHALRQVQMSEAFRQVYADVPGAIGDRARVICMGQYAGTQINTMLQFVDAYFNKTDPKSTYTGTPHPPAYYFWGGGGALYFGNTNRFGLPAQQPILNGGFEEPDLPPGQAEIAPANGGGWTFTGNAGICDTNTPLTAAITLAAPPVTDKKRGEGRHWVGFQFKATQDLFVHQLGLYTGKPGKKHGKIEDIEAALFDAHGKKLAMVQGIQAAKAGEDGFAYDHCFVAASSSKMPLPAVLKAGETYYVAALTEGASAGLPIQADPAIQVLAAASAPTVKGNRPVADWQTTPGSLSLAPLNLRFSPVPIRAGSTTIGVAPIETGFEIQGYASVRERFDFGTQAAFIAGKGSISRDFTLPADDACWITVNLAMDARFGTGRTPPLHIRIDGTDLSPTGLPVGGFSSNAKVFHYHASHVQRLTAGRHTLTLEMDDPKGATLFIDAVHLGSEQAFYGGAGAPNFPAGARAIGQTDSAGGAFGKNVRAECEMARNWGLVPMTYEGGWAVQADFDDYGMLAWGDLRYGTPATDHSLTQAALGRAFDYWCQRGGFAFAYFYSVSRAVADSQAPLLKAIRVFNNRLPAAITTENRIPMELTPSINHYEGVINSDWNTYRGGENGSTKTPLDATVPALGWKSWIVSLAETTDLTFTVAGSGGPASLVVDGISLANAETPARLSARARLVPGLHAIKVAAGAQPLTIERISVNRAKAAP